MFWVWQACEVNDMYYMGFGEIVTEYFTVVVSTVANKYYSSRDSTLLLVLERG